MNQRYMTFYKDYIQVEMILLSNRIQSKFFYLDFLDKEATLEEANRFVEIRKNLRQNQTKEDYIKESVTTIKAANVVYHYLYLQYYFRYKLHKSICVGRLFNNSLFGKRLLRQTIQYHSKLEQLIEFRNQQEERSDNVY